MYFPDMLGLSLAFISLICESVTLGMEQSSESLPFTRLLEDPFRGHVHELQQCSTLLERNLIVS